MERACERSAVAEFRHSQATQDLEGLSVELEELRETVSHLQKRLFDSEVSLKIGKIEQQAAEESLSHLLSTSGPE